jgi:membrane associated rhomboid family serine protease/Flp pilus assembly protein TadD
MPVGAEGPPVVTARPAAYRPPVTIAILGINSLVFVAMLATGVPIDRPSTLQLLKWGADFGPLSLGGQFWRVLTSNYVHIGIIHFAVNMWALWQLGRLAERIFGPLAYFLTYTAAGISGSLASLLWNPMVVSAGASGALFGIIGALIAALYLGKLLFPKPARQSLLKNLLWVAGINLYLGATIPGIDNAGHVGGLLMGLGLGAVLGPHLMEPPDRRRAYERIAFVAAAFLLIGFGTYVKQKNGYVAALNSTGGSTDDKLDQAIATLRLALKSNPNSKAALGLLGATYLDKKDYPNAESTLKRLLELDPNNIPAKYNLGLTYAATGRYEDARQIYAELVQRDPKNDDTWVLLGASLDGVGREQEAVAAYQKAIALNPKNAEAFRELGLAQMKLNQPDAAIASFQYSAQLDPTNAETQKGLAQVYTALGKTAEAAAAQQKAERLGKATPRQPAAQP